MTRAIFESPFHFHFRPPPPPSHTQTQLPDLTPWRPTRGLGTMHEDPPNEVPLTEDLQHMLEQLRVKRKQEDWEREAVGGASGDMSENEDGILLIPEGEAGACVWVQNWWNRRHVVMARGSEHWDVLDEDLGNANWELPSHIPPIRFGASMGFKPAPASMPPIIHPHTVSSNGHSGGLMSPSGTIRIQPNARPPPPPGA